MRAPLFTNTILVCIIPFLSFSQISVEDKIEDIEVLNLVNYNTLNSRENDDLLLAERSYGKSNSSYGSDSTTYNYDRNKNISSKHRLQFDNKNSKWDNSQLYKYEYDQFNNKISEITQLWKNDKWLNSIKYEYQYYSNNDLSLMVYREWRDSVWQIRYSEELMYNTNDSLVRKLIKNYSNSRILQSQNLYKYDSNNNKVENLLQFWNGSNWDDRTQIIYRYDSTKYVVADSTTEWYNNELINISRGEYKYDKSDFLLQYMSQEWYENKWINKHHFNYEYDSNHNLVELDFFIGAIWNNDWRLYNSTSNKYNRKNQLIHKRYEDFEQRFEVSTTYYYGELMASKNVLNKKNKITVFPNPSVGVFNLAMDQSINFSHLDVFDFEGRKVHSQKILNNDLNNPFDLTNLKNGNYIIQLSSKTKASTQKIIISK